MSGDLPLSFVLRCPSLNVKFGLLTSQPKQNRNLTAKLDGDSGAEIDSCDHHHCAMGLQ